VYRNINPFNLVGIVGLSLVLESLFILLVIPVAFYYHEPIVMQFLWSAVIVLVSGTMMFLISKGKASPIHRKEGFLIAFLIWAIVPVFGALPYLFSGEISNVPDAVFESVSGFTTTGSSVISDVESLSHAILFWRALTHWMGGLGILVLVVALIPFLQHSGSKLIYSEGNLSSTEKIRPRIIEVAKTLWVIYTVITLLETLILKLEGLSFFDALCHSFATVATGGFSTKNDSIVGMSDTIQYTIAFFMMISGMNFVLHYQMASFQFKKVFRNVELKFYFSLLIIAIMVVFITDLSQSPNVSTDFRDSVFQATSLLTCTGFVSSDYNHWATDAKLILLLVMVIGGCVGSTSGGIKIRRIVVVFYMLKRYVINLVHPKAIAQMQFDGTLVTTERFRRIVGFIFIYFLTIIVGTFVLMFSNLDLRTSLSAVVTTLGGVGPGFGLVGPMDNFALLSDFNKIYLCFNMILGRLEILPVLAIFQLMFRRGI